MARLALCERDRARGAVDGAWWPKSPDLGSELPDLVAVFGSWIGPVHRVVYDPSVWLSAPPRVIGRNAMISVDPYRLVFRDTIYLMGTHLSDGHPFSRRGVVRGVAFEFWRGGATPPAHGFRFNATDECGRPAATRPGHCTRCWEFGGIVAVITSPPSRR